MRAWKVKKEAIQVDQILSQREILLEARIKQLESTLSAIFDPTVRGKGRGKKSATATSSASVSSQAQQSQCQSQSQKARSTRTRKPPSVASEIWTDDLDDEEETFFLKNVELTLNGTLIDQVNLKSRN